MVVIAGHVLQVLASLQRSWMIVCGVEAGDVDEGDSYGVLARAMD